MKTNFTQSWLVRPLATIALIGGLSLGQVAQAAGIDMFTWTISAGGNDGFLENGEISINGPADAATITGSNTQFGIPTLTSMTTNTLAAGTVQFHWLYDDANTASPPAWNFFLWFNDGLGDGDQIITQSNIPGEGDVNFLVGAGSTFGMAIDATIDCCGAAVAEISSFSFSPSGQGVVPLPPAFLLFGSAIAGLGFIRKYKQARV